MPLIICKSDIINLQVDAIVVSTSTTGRYLGGTEKAIMDKGGASLFQNRVHLGDIALTENKITPGYDLDAKFVIHSKEPFYTGNSNDKELLKQTYINILHTAIASKCTSIAIPLLSSGANNYPVRLALTIANEVIVSFLQEHEMYIYLLVYDKNAFLSSKELFDDVTDYLKNQFDNLVLNREMETVYKDAMFDIDLDFIDKNFRETLFELIKNSGETNATIYRRANVDKRLFSKIKNNKNYHPSKKIALAFTIALKLDIDEADDFLNRAGYSLSKSNKMDLIVKYCIEHNIYNIIDVNEILYDYDQELLGSTLE